MKFHINKNGKPAPCNAQNYCPLGDHFDNPQNAEFYADQMNEYILSSWIPENLARKEFIQKTIYERKKALNEPYTMSEALIRGEYVQEKVTWALEHNLSTDKIYKNPDGSWSPERRKLHDKLLRKVLDKYKNVPNNKEVIFSAGLPGAGKTTILYKMGLDPNNYAIVNSDDFKELLAEENAIPKVDGLTPMEASTLVHNESSMLADRLLKNLAYQNKNIIYDFTCKTEESAESRMNILTDERFNYSKDKFNFVFVDVPLATSKERAKIRYKEGLNNFELGGRWVPNYVADTQKPETKNFNSKNAESLIKIIKNNKEISKPIVWDNKDIPTEIDFDEFKKGYKE